jgi:hypothetical protein
MSSIYKQGNSYLLQVSVGRTRRVRRLGDLSREPDSTPGPKVWQNLRSTRETELLKDFPIHVVCGWIGNRERIARRHYLQITEGDFDQATGMQGGLQRAAKSAAISSSEYAQLAQEQTKEPRFPAGNAVNAVPQLSSCAQDRI